MGFSNNFEKLRLMFYWLPCGLHFTIDSSALMEFKEKKYFETGPLGVTVIL